MQDLGQTLLNFRLGPLIGQSPFLLTRCLDRVNATERSVYNAAAGTEAQFRFEDDPDVFTPEGVRCDVIARVRRDHNKVTKFAC